MEPVAIDAEYIIYGPPFSLFTRKLEAALRFYGVPFRLEPKNAENASQLETRAGTHQVPVFETPENWLLGDTTPILALLDSRVPARRLFPQGPAGVLVHIIEEVLDEWLARTMVHYRWHYEENTRAVVSEILGKPVSLDEAREFPLAKWGPRACRATGTESQHQREQVEMEYMALIDALERQLGESRYALGDRPSAVDAILLGGLRAHTNADPIPDLTEFTRIQSWDNGEADSWDGDGDMIQFSPVTPFADHVLALARDGYAPFALGNARAVATGQKAFEIETYGESVSYLTRRYPEQSRMMVQRRVRDLLSDDERELVGKWLEELGLAECFMPPVEN
jgi:glutathione S-transferase